jgi:3-oxoacyl-[acyl-carrier protein] reductase
MDNAEAFDKFTQCAVEVLQVTPEQVKVEARFADDLDADSLDLVELVMALEEKFDINVDESELEGVETVGQANYSATKAGVEGFTKTLAKELGKFGITANAIGPHFIATDMTANMAASLKMSFEDLVETYKKQIAVGRVGQPADVAHAISFLVSEGAGFVSGQVIYVAGGPLC